LQCCHVSLEDVSSCCAWDAFYYLIEHTDKTQAKHLARNICEFHTFQAQSKLGVCCIANQFKAQNSNSYHLIILICVIPPQEMLLHKQFLEHSVVNSRDWLLEILVKGLFGV